MVDANIVELLLIEDNAADAEMTLRALKKINVLNNIMVATDGEEALDFIYCRGKFADRNFSSQPKLIFLDLKLPKVDGLEILKIIKNDPEKKTIPVVVLTSSKEEKDIIESYKLGVNSYIVKPVDADNFMDAVHKVGLYWLLLNEPHKG